MLKVNKEKVEEILKKQYFKKEMTTEEKDCVNFFLGNIDGNSGLRLRKFIKNNL